MCDRKEIEAFTDTDAGYRILPRLAVAGRIVLFSLGFVRDRIPTEFLVALLPRDDEHKSLI